MNEWVFYHGKTGKVCEKCAKCGRALKRGGASARLRRMKGDPAERAPAPSFVVCPPECAAAVRGALPPGCDLVVAGSPDEARAAFAARTGAPAPDVGAGEVTVDGRTFDLTALERAVFNVLSRSPGRSFSRAELLRAIHGSQAGSVRPRAVDATVSGLRRKLGPSGWRVQTVWGRGYRWNAGEGPSASPFVTAFRWSAGTLGVLVVAAMLVARPPRPEDAPVAPAAPEPTPEPAGAPQPAPAPAGEPEPVPEPAAAFDSCAAPAAPAPAPSAVPNARVAAPAPAAAFDTGAAPAAGVVECSFVEISESSEALPPKAGFKVHVLTAEDRTLSNLARSCGITLAELLSANPQIRDPDVVRAGQPVYVPERQGGQ